MKKHTVKSTLAALLCAALSLTALSGCTLFGGGTGKKSGLDKVKLEHVYKVTNIGSAETDDGKENVYVNDSFFLDGKTYLVANYYIDKTPEPEILEDGTKTEPAYEYENGMRLLELTEDGAFKLLREFKSKNENTGESSSSYENYNHILPLADGSAWVLRTKGYDDWSDPMNYVYENTTELVLFDKDGKEVKAIDLKSVFDGADENEYFYVNGLYALEDGKMALLTGDSGVMIFDGEGSLLKRTAEEEGSDWVSYTTRLASGALVGTKYTYDEAQMTDTRTIVRLNPETAKFEDVCEMPISTAYQMFSAGQGNRVLLSAQTCLYSFDLDAPENAPVEELNWLNSDINSNRVQVVGGLPDGRILAQQYDRSYDNRSFIALSKVADGDVVEKYVLNLASVYLDDSLTDAVISYNQRNEEYRIVYNDYSVYNTNDDYQAGTTQLNNDIISGKIPDIICLGELDPDTYVSKGLLYDLNRFMDADETFNRADYFENLFEAASRDGKLYSVFPTFSVRTLIGKTSIVGDRMSWTVDDLKKVMEQYPDAQVLGQMTKSEMLNIFCAMALDKFIDKGTGMCRFDSDDFIDVLELINSFPEEFNWDEYYSSDMSEEDYREREMQYFYDRTLLNQLYLSRFNNQYNARMFGEEVSYIGFPVPEGVGSAVMPQSEIAVSAKTKDPDACWQFVKYLLSEDYGSVDSYGFSINRKVTQKQAEEAIKQDKQYYAEEQDITLAEEKAVAIAEPSDLYRMKPITQADVDKVMELIEAIHTIYRENAEIRNIIAEEAGAYFAGQKSAKDVASVIQSKVQIYVNEGL